MWSLIFFQMPKIITLNGVDNVGKTTQMDLLAAGSTQTVHTVPKLATFDAGWKKVPGDFDWWFARGNHNEWLELMFASLLAREEYMRNSRAPVVLADRGSHMFQSVIAATLATRMQLGSTVEGAAVANEFCDRRGIKLGLYPEAEVLLEHGGNKESSVELTMARAGFKDDAQAEIYTNYQFRLYDGLAEQKEKGLYNSIKVNRKSIRDVQRELRELLNGLIHPKAFKKLNPTVQSVVGVTGNSETGKGTYAKILRDQWGFLRLKLNFFAQQAGKSPNDPTFFAALVESFEQFCRAHYYERLFSLESFHGQALIEAWAQYYGNKFTAVRVDSSPVAVTQRLTERFAIEPEHAIALVGRKNAQKALPALSDYACDLKVINNDGTPADLHAAVAVQMRTKPNSGVRYSSVEDLMLSSKHKMAIEEAINTIASLVPVELIAIAGSGGREDMDSNSDIDLYIVTNNDPEKVKSVLKAKARFIHGIKVGTCVYSTKPGVKQIEDAGKLAYVHYKLGCAAFPIIWKINDEAEKVIPRLNEVEFLEYARSSNMLKEYALLVEEELEDETTNEVLLAVIKHLHTIMKMFCWLKQVEVEGYHNVYTSFYKLFAADTPPTVLSYRDANNNGAALLSSRQAAKNFLQWVKSYLNSMNGNA